MDINNAKKVIFPLGFSTAFSLFGDATLYTVLPIHTQEIGIALGSVGILLGVNRAVRILLNGPAGMVYDRSPRRPLFVAALLIGVLSTALYAATSGFWPLLAGRLLWGLSWSFIWVGGTTIILDIAPEKDRGHWMGLYQTWFFLGTALGALTGGILTDLVGYSGAMWVGSLLATAGMLAALFFLPETRQYRIPSSTANPIMSAKELKNGLWIAATIYGINRFVTAGVLSATLGLLVQEQEKIHPLALGLASVTGILVSLRTLVSMLAAVTSGKASDWFQSRWKVAIWGLLIGAIGMALLAVKQPLLLITGIVLGAVAGGGLQTISSTLPGDIAEPHQQSTSIGMIHTAGDIGSAIGPPVAYALLPWVGLPGIYLLCSGLFLFQIIPVMREQNRKLPIPYPRSSVPDWTGEDAP